MEWAARRAIDVLDEGMLVHPPLGETDSAILGART